jgi:two-component system, sensor histidine kinase LadS
MNVFRLVLAALAASFFLHSNTYAVEESSLEAAVALSELADKDKHAKLPIVSLGNWPVAINAAEVVAASRETQIKFDPNKTHYASWDTPLWLRIRVKADVPTSSGGWVLRFNKPLVEQVEVYTQSTDGFWQKQTAGLFTAHSKWPQQSLTPQFVMPEWRNGEQDVLVRVLHHFPVNFKLTLQTAQAAASDAQNQFLAAGLLLGLMGLMCALSSVMAVIYRNTSYVWYALYVGISFFACASYVGIANYWLWPNSPWWATNSSATLTMISMMVQTQFCRTMFATKGVNSLRERHGLNAILFISGILTLLSVYTDSASVSALLLVIVVIALAASMLAFVVNALKQNSKIAKLWCFAYLPLLLVLALSIVDNLGWVALDWLPYYSPLYALAFEMPVLLIALHLHAKTLHGAAIRRATLASTDPTTGFVISQQFFTTLEKLCDAAEASGQDMAIAYVEVTFHLNYIAMRGKPPPERTQLRIVRLLRTVIRDHDTVVHIRQNLYAILMPNMTLGENLSLRLSRLVAIGGMTDEDVVDDVPIRFHIAATTLHSFAGTLTHLDDALKGKLNEPDGWHNKAIRFVRKRAEYSVRTTTL